MVRPEHSHLSAITVAVVTLREGSLYFRVYKLNDDKAEDGRVSKNTSCSKEVEHSTEQQSSFKKPHSTSIERWKRKAGTKEGRRHISTPTNKSMTVKINKKYNKGAKKKNRNIELNRIAQKGEEKKKRPFLLAKFWQTKEENGRD